MNLRTHTTKVVRLVLGIAILWYLFQQIPMEELGTALAISLSHSGWLGMGLGFTFLGLLMGVVRWKLILDTQGITLSAWKVFRIFFIGQFFNAFMPGACGGDVARAFYVARDFPGKRTEAASTVFIDRAAGLFSIIVFCCLVIVLRLPFFLNHQETQWPGLLMVVFLLLSVLGLLALFRRNLFEHISLFRKLESSAPAGSLIRRTYDAFYLYRDQHKVLFQATLLSGLNLFFLTMACVSFGYALELELVHPLVTHFTLFPIITVLAAIPLTPGALGLREGLFAGLYGVMGVSPAAGVSLSLLVYAGGLFCGLFGGALFISYTSEEHRGLRDEIQALREENQGS